LLDKLTVREHLELFSTIKGVPRVEETIIKMLSILDLERFANVNSSELSGGNKRKLSVGIAMIGNPPVVLLDEPSSGMDPEARRFMWDLISKCKDISIVLTTHSMEEAEALSTRLAIMVDGQFKCLGSIPHIKLKYGGGYEIEVKLLVKESEIQTVLLDLGLAHQMSKDEVVRLLEQKYPKMQLDCEAVLIELKKSNTVKAPIVAEWIAQETQGSTMLQYLQSELNTSVTVVEHFNTFFRLKFDNLVPLSNLFRILEQYVKDFGILRK
jgi:ATP-binding cassette, subfamily A (ABC1), member 3